MSQYPHNKTKDKDKTRDSYYQRYMARISDILSESKHQEEPQQLQQDSEPPSTTTPSTTTTTAGIA